MGGILGGVNDLLFGGQPSTPDFMALANQQTQANRPNQNTPYASNQWAQDPTTGAWTQNVGFNPTLQGANESLQGQWAQNAANGYGTGDDARRQSVDASWGQFQRMNDPMMAQREQKTRSDLLNMGLDMGSEGFNTGMGNTLQANDNMRLNAMDQAVQAGDRAQNQTFNQNRQSWMDPLGAMGQMQGLLGMPTVPQAGNYQQAGLNQFNAEQEQYGQQMTNITGLLQGAGSVAGAVGGMPSLGGGSGSGLFSYGGSPYSPGRLQGPNWGTP
jgi:hypothetical protein